MWSLSKSNGSVSPTSQTTNSLGLLRFMPFGTSPAVSRAGDFDGKVRKTIKQFTSSPTTPPCTIDMDDSEAPTPLNEQFESEDPFEVFVGGLRELGDDINEEELKEHFKQFGEVAKLELTRDRRRHDQRGFCFVTFVRKASAVACLEHKDHQIRGRSIAVERAMRDSGSTKTKKKTRRGRRNGRLQSLSFQPDNNSVTFAAPPEPKHFFSSWGNIANTPTQHNIPTMSTPSRPTRLFHFGTNSFNPSCGDTSYMYVATQPSTPVTATQQWNYPMSGSCEINVRSTDMPAVDRSYSQRNWTMGKESMIHQLYSGWRSTYSRTPQVQRLYEVQPPHPTPSLQSS